MNIAILPETLRPDLPRPDSQEQAHRLSTQAAVNIAILPKTHRSRTRASDRPCQIWPPAAGHPAELKPPQQAKPGRQPRLGKLPSTPEVEKAAVWLILSDSSPEPKLNQGGQLDQ